MVKFSEIGTTQGWPVPTFTSAKKLEYFNTLMAWCLDEDDGMTKIDFRMKTIYETLFAFQIFWEIDFDTMLDDGEVSLDGMLRTYDALKAIANIDEQLLREENVQEVLADVDMALAQEVKIGNSLEKIVKDGIEKLCAKIPDLDAKTLDKLTKNLGKEIAKINPDTLEVLKKVGK